MTGQRMRIVGWLLVVAWCGQAHAQAMPEHVQKALDRFVGKWEAESMVDGKRVVAELEAEWSADKTTLNYRWKGLSFVSRAPTTSVGTGGWDGSRELTVEKSFAADGSTFEATHQIGNDPNKWESPAEGMLAKSGGGFARVQNTRLITFKSDDVCVIEDNDLRIDGKQEKATTVTWRRAKSEAARYVEFWAPLLGNWKTRSETGGKTVEGTYRSQLAPNKLCSYSHATTGTEPAGNDVGGYDPVMRCWKAVGFSAAGDSSTLLLRIANLDQLKTLQSGSKGTYEVYRALASGQMETVTGDWIFPSWDDKQRVLKLTNTIKNGQPQPDVTIHYERQ